MLPSPSLSMNRAEGESERGLREERRDPPEEEGERWHQWVNQAAKIFIQTTELPQCSKGSSLPVSGLSSRSFCGRELRKRERSHSRNISYTVLYFFVSFIYYFILLYRVFIIKKKQQPASP